MSNPDQRFSKNNRLLKPTEFREVFNSANRAADANFVILTRRNELDVARLGTSIAKKNVHLATVRNRLRRLIRENFRRRKDYLRGFDVVVIAKKNINFKNNSMIAASLLKLWQKSKSA